MNKGTVPVQVASSAGAQDDVMVHVLEDCLDGNCLRHRHGGRVQRWFGDSGDSSVTILPSEEFLGGVCRCLDREYFSIVELGCDTIDNDCATPGACGQGQGGHRSEHCLEGRARGFESIAISPFGSHRSSSARGFNI